MLLQFVPWHPRLCRLPCWLHGSANLGCDPFSFGIRLMGAGGFRRIVTGEMQRTNGALEFGKDGCPFRAEQGETVLPGLGVHAEHPAAKLWSCPHLLMLY